jgi:hypothetical protein
VLLETDRILLVKLLPSTRECDFLDGKLYFNAAKYFSKMDDSDSVRFDADEALTASLQVQELAIADETGKWIPIGGLNGPVTHRDASFDTLNVLCVYGLTQRSNDVFHEKNLMFGDRAILISNLPEFLRRMHVAATAGGKKLGHGPIDYVDRNSYHGHMGPFRKFADYSYQNEFRFVIDGGDGNACRLEIGDIRDITTCVESAKLSSFSRTGEMS